VSHETKMLDTVSILKNAAEKAGFVRARFSDKDVPTDISNVTIFVYFGDLRHAAILSSLLLKRYREEMKGSKYFIMCSWDGLEGLFPFVSEYWSFKGGWKTLYVNSDGWRNQSEAVASVHRTLNRYFTDIVDFDAFSSYYDKGFKEVFFEKFKHVKRFRVAIPSSAALGNEFNRDLSRISGNKVAIFPALSVNSWKMGRVEQTPVAKNFWIALAKSLKRQGYTPVFMVHSLTHNLSSDLQEDFIHININNLLYALSAMRAIGCVLDVFTGISRLSILARTPYLCCDERGRYGALKEYEIDDLCGGDISRDNIYSFSQIHTKSEQTWENNLFTLIAHKLNVLFAKMDRDKWPSATQTEEIVPYYTVREIKSKMFGTRFIGVAKRLPILN
jgi:hypothetical protein